MTRERNMAQRELQDGKKKVRKKGRRRRSCDYMIKFTMLVRSGRTGKLLLTRKDCRVLQTYQTVAASDGKGSSFRQTEGVKQSRLHTYKSATWK